MKILIFNPFGIGDVIFTMPLVRNLKGSIKDISLIYLCNKRVYPLLKYNKLFDDVLIFEKDEWREAANRSPVSFIKKAFSFMQAVRKEQFDIVFDLSMNAQYGFFLKMAGIKKRIGFNYRERGRSLTHKIDLPEGFKDKHVARYNLDLLKFIDITPKECEFELSLSADIIAKAKKTLELSGVKPGDVPIVVCPGSGDSWGNTAYYKRWPTKHFLKLCDRLQKELKATILICGSAIENELCIYLHDNLAQKRVNLCDKISLDEFAGIISLSKLVITNDGGPFHLAQALQRPSVAFFGPVDEKVYGAYPDTANCEIMTSGVDCRPCYRAFKFPPCPYDKLCLRKITPKIAFEAAAKKIIDRF